MKNLETIKQELDYKTLTCFEPLVYLLSKIGTADKLKLVKLVYLADKYHLINYGRTITNDNYYAMQHGMVASKVKDILDRDIFALESEVIYFVGSIIDEIIKDEYRLKTSEYNYIALSETDKDALDFICKTFGEMSGWELRNYTHEYPEWKQHEDSIVSNRKKSVRVETVELFSLVDDKFNITEADLNNSKLAYEEKMLEKCI
jgi:uncharacterized phage-associated protein